MSIAYMEKQATKRNIKEEDVAAAAALTTLWTKYKSDFPGMTEAKIADDLKITQSMFNQLKNGTVTWSTDHVLLLANFFEVPPSTFKKIPYLSNRSYGPESPRHRLHELTESLPDYAVNEAIKRLTDIKELLESAQRQPKRKS